MRVFGRFVFGMLWRVAVFCLVVGAGLWWMNRDTGWDAKQAYLQQGDQVATGRVGVVALTFAMPGAYDHVFFENFVDKLFVKIIPWPINVLAGSDAGIALMDPANPYAPERFEPQTLADFWGREKDVDGVPYIEKYRAGEIRWVEPSDMVPKDTGYFLFPQRKSGVRTPTAKTLLKARYLYYPRLPNGYLPHEDQTFDMVRVAIDRVGEHPRVVATGVPDAFDPWEVKQEIFRVLDSGIDTLVLASNSPVYSDFEEFKGSFQKAKKFVDAWLEKNPERSVEILMAPMMSHQPDYADLWTRHLASVAPPAQSGGQSIYLIFSLHGLPVSQTKRDIWMEHYPPMIAAMTPKAQAVLDAKGYANTTIVPAFEGFADDEEDPDNLLVSVAEEIRAGLAAGADTVLVLPIEFLAENTDTLFAHAAVMFDGLPGYETYQGPPADVDWAKPYVRRFEVGESTVLYAGSPGGDAQDLASAALAAAISEVLPPLTALSLHKKSHLAQSAALEGSGG